MDKRVVLVDESIFTEEMVILHKVMNKAINILNMKNLIKGIAQDEYTNTIEDLKDIDEILKNLSEKKFEDAGVLAILLKY